mmetsp:Transcript_30434/g.36939  ORF Transcript_30434/g.36939 Transcript_30434/m.36939 type:complete len:857 (+) Transcript_30434:486-3056(+)
MARLNKSHSLGTKELPSGKFIVRARVRNNRRMVEHAVIHRCPRRKVHVQTPQGSVLTYEVDRSETANNLKKKVQAQLALFTEQSELVFGSQVIENGTSLSKAGVQTDAPILLRSQGLSRSQSSPCLLSPLDDISRFTSVAEEDETQFLTSPEEEKAKLVPVVPVGSSTCASAVKPVVRELLKGLKKGAKPRLEKEGLGGAYFFPNSNGKTVAILKPSDEEPLAPNNPKGFVGKTLGDVGLKRSVRVGEAAVREAAAFLLDHQQFARVPRTALVKATHPVFNYNSANQDLSLPGSSSRVASWPKLSSLQEFVEHDFDASDHSPSRFPVAEVHRLGILDLRIFNTDRHGGNILVCNSRQSEARISRTASRREMFLAQDPSDGVRLVPIDHGYSLPERVEGAYFEWLYWPQASLPFTRDELDYISSLDIKKDLALLRSELPMLREGCLRVLEVSTTVLQTGAAAGLSMAEIGNIISRPLVGVDEDPSELELLVSAAVEEIKAMEPVAEIEDMFEEDLEEEAWLSSDEDDEWSDDRSQNLTPSPPTHCVPRKSSFLTNMEEVLQFEFEDDSSSLDGSFSPTSRSVSHSNTPSSLGFSNSAATAADSLASAWETAMMLDASSTGVGHLQSIDTFSEHDDDEHGSEEGFLGDADFPFSPPSMKKAPSIQRLEISNRWGDESSDEEEEEVPLPEPEEEERSQLTSPSIKIAVPTTPNTTLAPPGHSSDGQSTPDATSFNGFGASMQVNKGAALMMMGMRTPKSPARKRSKNKSRSSQARGRVPGRRCDHLGAHGLRSKRQSNLDETQISERCDLGKLNEHEWRQFRTIFAQHLDEAIKSRGWKSATTQGQGFPQNFGTSCPRF